jgi:2,3-bisphosphoglycerate-dependent phosphoglycerate mutase
MGQLVLMRHGESIWNRESRFTGWIDVPLTAEGERQADAAGRALQRAGYEFDLAYTSILTRAVSTLWRIQLAMQRPFLPMVRTWRLNDRHYGALTGRVKAEVRDEVGEEQFRRWWRGYVEAPPPLDDHAQRELLAALGTIGVPADDAPPHAESLRDTWQRVLPLWQQAIAPALREGRSVLVVAHGNSLRALVKHLHAIGDDAIESLEMEHGKPTLYRFDRQLAITHREPLDL